MWSSGHSCPGHMESVKTMYHKFEVTFQTPVGHRALTGQCLYPNVGKLQIYSGLGTEGSSSARTISERKRRRRKKRMALHSCMHVLKAPVRLLCSLTRFTWQAVSGVLHKCQDASANTDISLPLALSGRRGLKRRKKNSSFFFLCQTHKQAQVQ